MSRTLYLYGFVPSEAPEPGDLEGIDEAPVRLLSVGGFEAVVSDVDAGAYDEETVSERLQDLEWVGGRGLAHERVVTWFVDRCSIVPVRFLTLFSGEDALRQHAKDRADGIRAQLDRFARAAEWDLKVAFDRETLEKHLGDLSSEIAALDEEIEEASPGRSYLLGRKREERAGSETKTIARSLARELLETVAGRALAVKEIPTPSPTDGSSVVLNAALLVSREGEGALREALKASRDRLERVGLDISFSGPWAPYRFVGAEGSDDDPASEARATE